MVKSLKFIKIKGRREAWLWDLSKKFAPGGQDLTFFENLPGGCQELTDTLEKIQLY